ncbi:MAG: DUF3105 domain-containing protein [Acidimicrobiia bacterium]
MKWRNASAGLILFLAAACSGGATEAAGVILEVETFPQQDVDVHLSESAVRQILAGEIEPPQYNSDPPTSGAHASKAAACGIFRQAVPDVYQLHDLAIGVVIFQYAPSLESVDIERIEELGRSFEERIIVAPRSGMDVPVIATAWTTMMKLPAVDEVLLRAFFEQYVGSGPEAGECPFDVDEGL